MTEEVRRRHGREKEPEADDPMELVIAPVPGGNPELMATCLIEEYAHLGMDEEQILQLFSQPVYATHAFYQEYGEAWVRNLIRRVLARAGRLRVTTTILHQIGGCNA